MSAPSESLFIGDLPPTITDTDLQTIFGAYGTVSFCKAFPAKAPGQKGAGIVTFSNLEEAKWFEANVNGNVPQGLETPIIVRFKDQSGKAGGKGPAPQWQQPAPQAAKGGWAGGGEAAPQAAKGGWAGGGGGAAAPDGGPSNSVFIGDTPGGLDDAGVRAIFEKYGTVTNCKALPAKVPGGTGACLVSFATVEEATWLVENVNGNVPEGLETPVVVKFKSAPGSGGGGGAWNKGGKDGGAWGKGGAAAGAGADAAGPYAGGKGPAKGSADCDIEQVIKGLNGKGGKLPDENQVYIRGLPSNTSDLDIYKIFGAFGGIPNRGVKAMIDQEGACTGVGFVDFLDSACAQLACESLNGTPLPDGTSLQVTQKNFGRGKGKGKAKGGEAPVE